VLNEVGDLRKNEGFEGDCGCWCCLGELGAGRSSGRWRRVGVFKIGLGTGLLVARVVEGGGEKVCGTEGVGMDVVIATVPVFVARVPVEEFPSSITSSTLFSRSAG